MVDGDVINRCSGCRSVKYCNKECQRTHWKEHRILCHAIQELEKDFDEKSVEACSVGSHLTPKQKNIIANLIGERCMIDCYIGSKPASALWDTGAQISLISSSWLEENIDNFKILKLSKILDRDLEVEGVSGIRIPYEGYCLLEFMLKEKIITVPFLVTKEKINNPIIGYNVISALMKVTEENVKHGIVEEICKYTDREVDTAVVSAIINAMNRSSAELSPVKVLKEGVTIKAVSSAIISCIIATTTVNNTLQL